MLIYVRENLIMRTLSASDATAIYATIDANRQYLREWLPWVDASKSPADTVAVITDWAANFERQTDIVLGIYADDTYVGNMGLHGIKSPTNSAEIGYWLAENQQGRGIITACVAALTDFAFNALELNRIQIRCAEGNAKSRAVPERLGYAQEARFTDGERLYGVYHDLIVYCIVRRNWRHSGVSPLALVAPRAEHMERAAEYRREHGDEHIHGSGGLARYENYEDWLEHVKLSKVTVPPEYVPGDTYLAMVGGRIVGMISVRHRLNVSLLRLGGHIGYGVRPSERRKGYATKMLALGLEKCRQLCIDRALITCDKDNIASAKTILTGGGVLENEIVEDNGNILQRYWVDLSQ